MKVFKLMLPVLAIVTGVAGSAFMHFKNFDSDKVWFKVNPTDGTALDPTAGYQGDLPPVFMGCGDGSVLCASSLSIDEQEVTPNATPGSFSIASNVDITLSCDEHVHKNE